MRAIVLASVLTMITSTAFAQAMGDGAADRYANNPTGDAYGTGDGGAVRKISLHARGRHKPTIEKSSYPWITEARKYVGTNPTGMGHEWCARFVNLVLDRSGLRGTRSDRADSFARYGRAVAPRTPGAIAVWPNHVALVVGCVSRRCTMVSGNDYGRLVREVDRDSSGVIAWRMPVSSGMHTADANATTITPLPRARPDIIAARGNGGASVSSLEAPPPNSTPAQTSGAPAVESTAGDAGEAHPPSPLRVASAGPKLFTMFDDMFDSARAYLVETAHAGYTMHRIGTRNAVGMLQPVFALRLAETVRDARLHGIDRAGIMSSYRPVWLHVGGFANKFNSWHTYGLAVDMGGIGGPGSSSAIKFHRIAAMHQIWCVYGPYNHAEWNHCQATRLRVATSAMRRTVTARGPRDRDHMWRVASRYIDVGPTRVAHDRRHRRYVRHGREAG